MSTMELTHKYQTSNLDQNVGGQIILPLRQKPSLAGNCNAEVNTLKESD